jgi:hypothetical protein
VQLAQVVLEVQEVQVSVQRLPLAQMALLVQITVAVAVALLNGPIRLHEQEPMVPLVMCEFLLFHQLQ